MIDPVAYAWERINPAVRLPELLRKTGSGGFGTPYTRIGDPR